MTRDFFVGVATGLVLAFIAATAAVAVWNALADAAHEKRLADRAARRHQPPQP